MYTVLKPGLRHTGSEDKNRVYQAKVHFCLKIIRELHNLSYVAAKVEPKVQETFRQEDTLFQTLAGG